MILTNIGNICTLYTYKKCFNFLDFYNLGILTFKHLHFRFLATGCSYRSLAFTFRMGKSTISNIVMETCAAIWDKLVAIYLPKPTIDTWKSNARDFYENWSFPNCLGSIDA